ncbi:MAG: Aspartate aminotransferase [Hyphomicrobiales bacterium]|nr:Aspartate aminotransferase [Hyphomicrobiales bacterium]
MLGVTLKLRPSFRGPEAERIDVPKPPERVSIASPKGRRADIELLSKARRDYMDTAHSNTVRFPPPQWAARA